MLFFFFNLQLILKGRVLKYLNNKACGLEKNKVWRKYVQADLLRKSEFIMFYRVQTRLGLHQTKPRQGASFWDPIQHPPLSLFNLSEEDKLLWCEGILQLSFMQRSSWEHESLLSNSVYTLGQKEEYILCAETDFFIDFWIYYRRKSTKGRDVRSEIIWLTSRLKCKEVSSHNTPLVTTNINITFPPINLLF